MMTFRHRPTASGLLAYQQGCPVRLLWPSEPPGQAVGARKRAEDEGARGRLAEGKELLSESGWIPSRGPSSCALPFLPAKTEPSLLLSCSPKTECASIRLPAQTNRACVVCSRAWAPARPEDPLPERGGGPPEPGALRCSYGAAKLFVKAEGGDGRHQCGSWDTNRGTTRGQTLRGSTSTGGDQASPPPSRMGRE